VIYLLDTSALFVLYRKETGVDRLLALYDDPNHIFLISAVSVAEFGRKLRESWQDIHEVDQTLDRFTQLFERVVDMDEVVARLSLKLADSASFRLPLADALIAATALSCKACLVHKDKHMATIPQDVLPTLNLAV